MLIVNLSLDKSKLNPYISSTLLKNIEENLEKNKKILLYLNKRGEYSSLVCKDCQYIYKCPNCDVSLNIHKNPGKLICHICGYNQNLNLECEKCGGTDLLKIGVGTEQIEESLKLYFKDKDIKIFRFDLDNLKNKTEKKQAIEEINNANIVIGTKMMTTGFDLRNIGLIGIILVEQELIIPNYNTEEMAYTNINQVLGRGNRAGEKTQIIVQSFSPENENIKALFEKNYKDFFKYSLSERKLFNYPPFKQMAVLEYRHNIKQKSIDFMTKLKDKLDQENIDNKIEIILNNVSYKRNNSYHTKIVLKGDNVRDFVNIFRKDILKNSELNVSFL